MANGSWWKECGRGTSALGVKTLIMIDGPGTSIWGNEAVIGEEKKIAGEGIGRDEE